MRDFKLRPPLPHHHLIHRPRLLRRLDAADGPLVVLSAPAGAGKTALLADWSRGRLARGDCAWLSLDAHDNRPERLWGGVRDALRRARPELCLPEDTGGWTVDLWIETMLPALLAALPGDRPFTLILDGLEHVTDDDAVTSLGEFIVRLPAGCGWWPRRVTGPVRRSPPFALRDGDRVRSDGSALLGGGGGHAARRRPGGGAPRRAGARGPRGDGGLGGGTVPRRTCARGPYEHRAPAYGRRTYAGHRDDAPPRSPPRHVRSRTI